MPRTPSINREVFFSRLNQCIADVREASNAPSLVLVEVLNLPRINMQLGFDGGDIALENCFKALASVSSKQDMVYRVGDKRFCLIVPPLKSPAFIGLAVNKTVSALHADHLIPLDGLNLEVRLGVALVLGDADAQEVLLRAEYNLAQARARQQTFSLDDLAGPADTSPQLERDYENALRSNAFELYYQPKVNLRTGAVGSAATGSPTLLPPLNGSQGLFLDFSLRAVESSQPGRLAAIEC